MRSKLATIVPMANLASRSLPTAPRFVAFIAATMNGWKLPILFEEVGHAYDVVAIDFAKNEQKAPEFLAINPNGRIPALHDRATGVTVAESGAILEYLADHGPAQALLPSDVTRRYAVLQWVYWQVSGLGPMMGQAMYFQRIAAPQGHDVPFAVHRFVTESERLLQVLDKQLEKNRYVCGSDLTIADVACYPYARSHFWAKVDVSAMPHLQRWLDELDARPGFQVGLTVPNENREFFGEGDVDTMVAKNAARFALDRGSEQKTEK